MIVLLYKLYFILLTMIRKVSKIDMFKLVLGLLTTTRISCLE